MSVRDIPIDRLDTSKVGRPFRQPQFHESSPVNAFDTETRSDGKIYLLSYVYDGSESTPWEPGVIGNDDFLPLTSEDIFSKLVARRTRRPAVNVWANLDFDVNAVFGTILSEEQMQEIADTNTTTFTLNDIEYTLTYINRKFLSISDEHHHTSTHYDILQFFNSSLNQAAESWLGESKDDIDPTKADQYPWETVVDYAKRDAVLTQKLWKRFIAIAEGQLDIPMGKPISTGYVAQQVVFDTLVKKPNWGNSQFQDMARQSYFGGRFEVFRRGLFDNVVGLDINSAYPYHMAHMPDLGTCNIEVGNASLETIETADWGFADVTVTTDTERNIQPFPNVDATVYFPATDTQRLTVTTDELLFALHHDYLEDFTIHKTGLVFEKENVQRPFQFLESWYDDRVTYKQKIQERNDRWDKFQFVVKVIMNSVYGKTCQITEKQRYADTESDYETKPSEYITEGYTGRDVIGTYEAGDLFNPFYAAYITANTRLQLHDMALSLGVEDDTIMFATDCLAIEADVISQSQLDRILSPDTLGGWDFDYEGSAFVVGSGVYDVFDESGELYKLASRGFKEITKNYDSWRHAAKRSNGKIILENERPARFKEWLLHDGHPRPAEFFMAERTLTPDFDSKRNWHETATFDTLLTSNHASDPKLLST